MPPWPLCNVLYDSKLNSKGTCLFSALPYCVMHTLINTQTAYPDTILLAIFLQFCFLYLSSIYRESIFLISWKKSSFKTSWSVCVGESFALKPLQLACAHLLFLHEEQLTVPLITSRSSKENNDSLFPCPNEG